MVSDYNVLDARRDTFSAGAGSRSSRDTLINRLLVVQWTLMDG